MFTYTSLLQHCKTLEQHCEQFQKAQVKGYTERTTLSAPISSSVHQDAITIHNTQYIKCSYKHPQGNCPATGKECYNCQRTGHYTDIAVVPQADTGSPTTEATATVLTTHRSSHHRRRYRRSPHQNSIRSVILHPILSQAQKLN